MKNEWIKLSDSKPKNGQSVLTYYDDIGYDVEQFEVFTYYTKGSVIDTKVCKISNSSENNLLNTLFGEDNKIIAKEDGFYIMEYDEDGNVDNRKHADVITHWMPLVGPSNK